MELSLRDMPFGMGGGAGAAARASLAALKRFWLRSISRGNRLLAASGFNDVSWMGILTYPRKLGGA